MTATSIYINGRVVRVPGSYTKIDASGLDTQSLSSTGVLAIIGEGVGGQPVSTSMLTEEFIEVTSPAAALAQFRDGPLREACAIAFNPGSDAQIPGGAQSIVCMKTNQATQSSRTFSNSYGTALTVTSQDYGEHTNQVSVEHEDGSSAGKAISVVFEDNTETADNLGDDPIFSLIYREPAGGLGWDYARAQMLSNGLRVNVARRDAGLDSEVTATVASEAVEVLSANAADTTQTITIYGLVGGVATREVIQLNGTTVVTGSTAWDIGGVRAAVLSAATAGNITVRRIDNTGIMTVTAAALFTGARRLTAGFVANAPLYLRSDGSSTASVILVGLAASGAFQMEVVTLAGTTPVATTSSWSRLDYIMSGAVAAARQVHVSGVGLRSLNSAQTTVRQLADFVNARQVASATPGDPADGFELEILTGNEAFEIADMDLAADAAPTTNADITLIQPSGSSILTTALEFTAQLDAMVGFYQNFSELADAERIAFTPRIVDLTVTGASVTSTDITIDGYSPAFTSGGSTALTAAAMIAAYNADHRVNGAITASAGSTTSIVRLTATTPRGFVLVEGSANVTNAVVQSTAGVGSPPTNTTMPEFLTGGSEGTSTFSDYQTALNLLRNRRVNTIVALSHNPAVHAAVDAHCAYMCGIGRMERDAVVGLQNDDLDGLPSMTQIRSQVRALNSRHIRATAQTMTRFDTSGVRTVFDPMYLAVAVAGMQAGSGVGLPLTHKFLNAQAVAQHSSWNPVDDAELAIASGLCFFESLDGVGIRMVRNITTWLKSANLAYVEASTNQSVNTAVYELRTRLEDVVGQRAFPGTIAAARTAAAAKLDQLVSEGFIAAWRSLSLNQVGDVINISVELAPTLPVNFVLTTVHLVTSSASA